MKGSLKEERKPSVENKAAGADSRTPQEPILPEGKSDRKRKPSQEKAASQIPLLPKELTPETSKNLPLSASSLITALNNTRISPYVFESYDLGPHKVKIQGSTTMFYSPDFSTVKIERSQWLYGKKQIYSQFNKLGHSLSIYSYAGPPATVDDPLQFNLITNNGIILTFSKRKPFRPNVIPKVVPTSQKQTGFEASEKISKEKDIKMGKSKDKIPTSNGKRKGSKYSENIVEQEISEEFVDEEKLSNEVITEPEVTFFYDMKLSCPNSLTVETVVGTDDSNPFYIRQKYISEGPICDKIRDESYRCFLRNGNVLVFNTDETVKILTSDGTIFYCNEFMKPEPPSTPSAETIQDQPIELVNEENIKPKKNKTKGSSEDKKKKVQIGKIQNESKIVENTQEEIEEGGITDIPSRMLSEKSSLWEITDYEILTAHGVRYKVLDGVKEKTDYPLLLRTATDFELCEVFTRREDGTNTLLRNDGSLNVAYPDGTRITSTPIELGDFKWAPEEIEEIQNAAITKSSKESGETDTKGSRLSEGIEMTLSELIETIGDPLDSESLNYDNYDYNLDTEGVIEPFVLIGFSCKIEHPNYATVSYEVPSLSAVITCPKRVEVKVASSGTFRANIQTKTLLEVNPMSIVFEAAICNDCR